jgi:hypothetical protein
MTGLKISFQMKNWFALAEGTAVSLLLYLTLHYPMAEQEMLFSGSVAYL